MHTRTNRSVDARVQLSALGCQTRTNRYVLTPSFNSVRQGTTLERFANVRVQIFALESSTIIGPDRTVAQREAVRPSTIASLFSHTIGATLPNPLRRAVKGTHCL